MAQKSIVDRVLMLAAGICAAALVWQLTVLLTSKGRTSPASGPLVAAVSSAPSAQPTPPAAAAPTAVATPVRVVYAGTEASTKTSVKASDPPPAPAASATPAPPPAALATVDDAPSTPGGLASEPRSTDTSSVGPLALVTSPSPDFAAVPDTDTDTDTDADRTATTAPPPSPPRSRVAVAKPEPPPIEESTPASSPSAGGGIDLNRASVDALNRLRGAGHIGQAIVSHRPYRSVEDLVKKRVLRRDVYEQIKQQVSTQ